MLQEGGMWKQRFTVFKFRSENLFHRGTCPSDSLKMIPSFAPCSLVNDILWSQKRVTDSPWDVLIQTLLTLTSNIFVNV